MAKRIVAHSAGFVDRDEEMEVAVGDTFKIIEEPEDFMAALLIASIEAKGMGEALLADMGDSYMVLTVHPNDEGRSVYDMFDVVED